MNEILGIKQGTAEAPASADASGRPSPTDRETEQKEKKEKREKKEKKAKAKKDEPEKAKKSKSKDTSEDDYKTDKKSKLGKRKRAAEAGEAGAPAVTSIEVVEETNVVANAHGQFVFQYLSNKLIRRKAEVAKQRREAGAWWGPSPM